jgi:hypothetical protein
MRAPLVHLNGTSKDALFTALLNAGRAVRIAIEAVRETAPHQRDYHPLPPAAWEQARAEWEARMASLHTVYKELEAIAIAVNDGKTETE